MSTADVYLACVEFLNREAELLDNRQLRAWLGLLAPEVEYRVPLRISRDLSGGAGFSTSSYFFKEDHKSLSVRVARFDTEYAWSEDPPSRTRRFVSNVRAECVSGGGFGVKSNLMLYRSRGDTTDYDLICGERHDHLVEGAGDGEGLKLARRVVYLDHTTLGTLNLSIFL